MLKNLIFNVKEMFLYRDMHFSFVSTAAADRAILAKVFGFDPLSEILAPRYLKQLTASIFFLSTFN